LANMGPAKDKHGVRESFAKVKFLFAKNGRSGIKEFWSTTMCMCMCKCMSMCMCMCVCMYLYCILYTYCMPALFAHATSRWRVLRKDTHTTLDTLGAACAGRDCWGICALDVSRIDAFCNPALLHCSYWVTVVFILQLLHRQPIGTK